MVFSAGYRDPCTCDVATEIVRHEPQTAVKWGFLRFPEVEQHSKCVGHTIRGVQIQSESDRIRSDFGTEILISDRIGKVVS